ncbi:MAG: hypothetical protein WCW14_00865 [Candidatus Paceibacterota bacterium]|jgi:hypothetical protein
MTLEERISLVKDWLIMNSGATPYIIGFGLRQWTEGTYRRYPKTPLISLNGMRVIKDGSEAQFVADRNEYHNSFKNIFDNVKVLDSIYADFIVDEKNFLDFVHTIEQKGEGYLHQHFDEFVKYYDAEYISAVVIDGALVYGENFFNEMIKKYPESENDIRILTAPYGRTFIERYKIALLDLAIRYVGMFKTVEEILNNKGIKEGLEKIKNQFHWIKNNYKNVEPLSIEFFTEQLLEFVGRDIKQNEDELNELIKKEKYHQEQCLDIRSKNKIEADDYDRILWIGKIAWWVDRRKEYNLIANHYLGRHLKYLCQKYNWDYNDALFLAPWEVEIIESGKKEIKDFPLKERRNENIIFFDKDGNWNSLIGKEASILWDKISPILDTTKILEIKGTVARMGKVIGKARVVMDAHNPENLMRAIFWLQV